MDLSLPVNKQSISQNNFDRDHGSQGHRHGNHQVCFRWDKGDIAQYYNLTGNMLCDIQAPTYLLTEAPGDHITALNIVNNYYLDIVNSL